GAVYVNNDALRGPAWRAGVSAAGPAMNLLCLLVIALVLRFVPLSETLNAALSMLGFLQATALILNLLPVPGLDGFGILESLFPASERAAMAQIGQVVFMVFLVVMVTTPELLRPIWIVAERLTQLVGVDSNQINSGYELFRFWRGS